jgi:hypothetical protein
MGFCQLDPATTSKSTETSSVFRAFCVDHFGNKFFRVRLYFHKDTGQILFLAFFAKENK